MLIEALKILHEDMGANSDLAHFQPVFSLLGSIREGTRLDHANEIDIAVHFQLFRDHPLQLKNDVDASELIVRGAVDPIMRFLKADRETLDYPKFFCFFMDQVESSLRRVELPLGLSCTIDHRPEDCPVCDELSKAEPTRTHCARCLPAITHTKVGLCLLFTWRDPSGGEAVVLSVDLVPIFPLLRLDRSLEELHEAIFWTLYDKRPPGWREYCQRVAEKDRILTFSNDGGAPPTRDYHYYKVSIKFLNFLSDERSSSACYVVRPGQGVDSDWMVNDEELRETYVHLKALKAHLGLGADVSSFFLKKMVYSASRSYVTNITNIPYNLTYRLRCTVMDTDLKGAFRNSVNLEGWINQVYVGNRGTIPLN